MKQRMPRVVVLLVCALLLSSCGFVTAPLGYGVAYAAKGGIKVADQSIVVGKSAANVVADTAIYVGEAASSGMQSDSTEDSRSGSLRRR